MTRACHCCGQETDRAQSSAPVVVLLRILELCWRERHALPADVCERIREQLQGPAGDRALADARVLDATGAAPQWSLLLHAGPDVEGTWTHAAAHAELARRGLKP